MPIALHPLRVDTVLGFDVYIRLKPGQPFTLYCPHNTAFSGEKRQRLLDNHVHQVFIPGDQRTLYRGYVETHLADILHDPTIPASERAEVLYSSAHGAVEDLLLSTSLTHTQECVQRAKAIVRHTVDAMFKRPSTDGRITSQIELSHLLEVTAFDYSVYTHSVNVTAYSVALAQRVGYTDPATLRELANGALLHDIGKSKIDPSIVHSRGKLSPEQREELKHHPTYGYSMLHSTHCLGEIALDIVHHHHEKLHGGGYPDNLEGDLISPFVRIVTISDVFDALTTERGFQSAAGSFRALNLMHIEMSRDLDPRLVRAFVTMMGAPGPSAE